MSRKRDEERAREARHAAAYRSEGVLAKLARLRVLWMAGKSDAEIGAALGWCKRTVIGYRQVLTLTLGVESGGRWRDKARSIGRSAA